MRRLCRALAESVSKLQLLKHAPAARLLVRIPDEMQRWSFGGLLLSLVFSLAHAPTIQLRGALLNINSETQPHESPFGAFDFVPALSNEAPPVDAWIAAALQQDFAEDGAIKRFMLDDFQLPTLDVSLPALFDWSDPHREYLAANRWDDAATFSYALDNPMAASFPVYGFGGRPIARGQIGGGGGGGMSAPSAAGGRGTEGSVPNEASANEPSGSTETPSDDSGEAPGNTPPTPGSEVPPVPEPGPSDSDPGALPPFYGSDPDPGLPSEPLPPLELPTVQVPGPDSLGLFVLGLTGLCLANRRKQPKRQTAK